MPRLHELAEEALDDAGAGLCLLAARHDDDVALDRERARMGRGVAADRALERGHCGEHARIDEDRHAVALVGLAAPQCVGEGRVRGVEGVAREDHRQIIGDGETLAVRLAPGRVTAALKHDRFPQPVSSIAATTSPHDAADVAPEASAASIAPACARCKPRPH